MPKHLLFLDNEAYYDDQLSLRKMTPAEYILHPGFEEHMWAVKADGGPHEIIDGPDFPKWLAQFDPADTTTVTFNALYDNSILAWRHGFVPHTMVDAMAMVRALDGHRLTRFTLAAISEHLGLDAKGDCIHKVKGLRREQIKATPGLWDEFKAYALRDNINCESIFLHYHHQMPWSERRLMDMVLRCCIEPEFVADLDMLEAHIGDVKDAKEALVRAAGDVDKKTIMSTAKFQAALESLGVDIEYKDSPTAKDEFGEPKQIPAFSKTDEFMERLQNDDDPVVAALATARVGLKSTLEETRSQRFLNVGRLPWPGGAALMPLPLRYGGAHTHRLSGDWKMNPQNMPTVRGSKGKSKLRLSLKAPPGHTVVTCDLGQIEARLVAWLCGAVELLTQFSRYDKGDKSYDPYNRLGEDIFGRPVNRKLVGTVDEIMGFIGKTGILGLGYGCGKDNFDTMVVRGARTQGVDISSIYNREIGDKAVDTYRTRFHQIPTAWNRLSTIVSTAWFTKYCSPVHFGPCTISHGQVLLPSGLAMHYADPQMRKVKRVFRVHCGGDHWTETERWTDEFTYRYGKMRHRLYGPKLLENISQALARVIVMNAALRIRDRGKGTSAPRAFQFKLQAHDELVYIVPDEILDDAKKIIHEEMIRPPSWGRDIPLVADIGTGKSYGEAK